MWGSLHNFGLFWQEIFSYYGSSLALLALVKYPIGRLGPLVLSLQEYDIKVIYKSAKLHQKADFLSRRSVDPIDHTDDDTDLPVLHLLHFMSIGEEPRSDTTLETIIDEVKCYRFESTIL